MHNFHDELLKEFPNQIHICEGRRCFESNSGNPDNVELENAIAAELGTTADKIYAKTINIAGKNFRIECCGCLGGCSAAPCVDIIVNGQGPSSAKIPSLNSLKEQVKQVLDGTWDYPGWPE